MKRVFSGVLASLLALTASATLAQTKPPLKLGANAAAELAMTG